VLFANVGEASFGPISVPIPDLAGFDPAAALIAAAAAFALIRFHVGMLWVLALAALAGLAVRLLA
jgi:chromate transporter